ncbi:hypothetical protein JCM8547_005410 [Rhodosporidiobolus lusitaniae]
MAAPDKQDFVYLITGASRSLGLGYARGLLASSPSTRIIAGARNPSSAHELKALADTHENKGRVYVLKLDVADEEQVEHAAKEMAESGFLGQGGGLDALVLNAGTCSYGRLPSETTKEEVLENLQSNLFGAIHTVSAFLPLLRKGRAKQIIGVSSNCGSIEAFGVNTRITAYAISKVSLNMYLKKLSVELEEEGFTVVMLHPGYVRTPINNGNGDLSTEEAVELALENVFLTISKKDNGRFVAYDGSQMPW